MKKVIIILGILLVVALLGWFIYSRVTTKITFNADKVSSVNITGFGSIGLDTDDKSKVKKVIDYLNSMSYYKNSKRELHNSSADASISMSDKDGKVIEQIDFFGDLAEYKGNQYKVVFFMSYNGLEKLCNRLNENK